MQVIVKKKIVFDLIKKALTESRTGNDVSGFVGIGDFGKDEEPIIPKPHMATQLTVEEPPVEDPDYHPSSKSELSHAAHRMMREVPDKQVEFAYRELHRLLDRVLDKEDQVNLQQLSEALLVVINESQEMKTMLLQNAAKKVAEQFESADQLAAELVNDYEEFDGEDPWELARKIEDIVSSMQGLSEPQQQPQPSASQKKNDMLPAELEPADLRGYDKAQDKSEYMNGYNTAADFDYREKTEEELEAHDVYVSAQSRDFKLGYDAGVDVQKGISIFQDKTPEEERAEKLKINRSRFGDDFHPLLKLIPEFFEIIDKFGMAIEVDYYNFLLAGMPDDEARDSLRKAHKTSNKESFVTYNILKPYFTFEFAQRSLTKHLDLVFTNKINSPEATDFRKGFFEACKESEMSLKTGIAFFSKIMAKKIIYDRDHYNYEPDKNKMLQTTIENTFAELVTYQDRNRRLNIKRKEYQGTNSQNFRRNVKQEYEDTIIDDFLQRLVEKYLSSSNDVYRIKSGRKDPNDPKEKRLEYYTYQPLEVKEAAESYARKEISDALKAQASGTIPEPDELEIEEPILPNEAAPEPLSDKQIAMKLSNAKDFQTLAPFFGPTSTGGSFSSSSGMRQWFLKFAKRFFEMGLIDASEGDRTLLKFHNHMVEYSLKSLSEGLGELVKSMPEGELKTILDMCKDQVSQGFQSFIDVGDLHKITVTGNSKDGNQLTYPFLKSLGGQLTRIVNGAFFERVMKKIDKDWNDYTAEIFSTNKEIQAFIAEQLADNPDIKEIDSVTAGKIAEYWTGKKKKPEIVFDKKLKKKVYEPDEKTGKPTTGARNLLKFGITPDIYNAVKAESLDWFEDMIMTDFARIQVDGGDFKGKYREMIDTDYKKMNSDKSKFKKIVLTALDSLITSSAQRQALDNLQDYEVPD